MKIKVCGMKHPENVKLLGNLSIDYMGLIFYPKSSRYVDSPANLDLDKVLPNHIQRVGVFVDSSIDFIREKIEMYDLNYIQLHGEESVDFCLQLKAEFDLSIIKAFNVSEASDFEQIKDYQDVCDYFLFDTKTPQHGGSGVKFDWSILKAYKGKIPFFLSGGISLDDVESIKQLSHPQLYAIDINSKFEIESALKDIKQVEEFIKRLKI